MQRIKILIKKIARVQGGRMLLIITRRNALFATMNPVVNSKKRTGNIAMRFDLDDIETPVHIIICTVETYSSILPHVCVYLTDY